MSTAALLRSRIFADKTLPLLDPESVPGATKPGVPERHQFTRPGSGKLDLRPRAEPRRQMRVYDRSRVKGRKRLMGGSGKLPNMIRQWYTEGERAVLGVIAAEVKRSGRCELSVLTLAERAGVGVRLVQYTLATARSGYDRKLKTGTRRPILINVEYRRARGQAFNDLSIITIVSREWLLWLNYRPSENPDTGCTEARPISFLYSDLSLSPVKSKAEAPVEGAQWALEGRRGGRSSLTMRC